jgi:hypothetical protein
MNTSGNQKVIFSPLLCNMSIQQNTNAPLYFTKSMLLMDSQQTLRPVPIGGTESDLTELSWLTNGMNVLSKTASTDGQSDLRCIQEKENFSNIDDLDSSFSSTISSISFSSLSSSSASCINTKKSGIQAKNGQKRDTCPMNLTKDTPITSIEQFKAFFNRKKPPLTINCLIFMAIEESASKCLPVRDIYNWIETNFPSYKSLAHGWKSSIRHNLSFSKCFRKMDRLESCKYFKSKNLTGHNASKQRLSSSFGTCWKVNTNCRDYLIYALRKSSFWTKYNRFYPNLVDLVQNSHCDSIVSNHHVYHAQPHPNKACVRKDKKQQECHKHDIMDEDVSSSSLSWLTNTSSSLSTSYLSDNDDNNNNDDVAKAAEILVSNKLTNSKRQLFHHKPFSYLNLNNHATVSIINSDLEFEVASTLVRMKSLIETRN